MALFLERGDENEKKKKDEKTDLDWRFISASRGIFYHCIHADPAGVEPGPVIF